MAIDGPSPLPTIAVISDLHVQDVENGASSWLSAHGERTPTGRDLVADLSRLIVQERLSADVLVCAGDIGDKASAVGIVRGWDIVQQVGADLSARTVIGTAGNHDIASRSDGDPVRKLRELYPPFPFATDEASGANAAYWGQHFALYRTAGIRFLNINSAAHHRDEESAKRGRLEPGTVREIERALTEDDPAEYNVLLCHHHPVRAGPIDIFDESEMFGAQLLLDILQRGTYGSWIVIHGHKHVPRMNYYVGGNSAIPLFCSGSLSAKLFPEAAGLAHNQFYLLEFVSSNTEQSVDTPALTCSAWSWNPSFGWARATQRGGIMHGAGFGWRVPLETAAMELAQAFETAGERWLTREELLQADYRYALLTTHDQCAVQERLKDVHRLGLVADDGLLEHIGRME